MGDVMESATTPKSALAGRRDFPPLAERMLIIGLDGATFDLLDPLMEEGRMPRLQAAIAAGARGPLHSTIPPITPAAWTTFLTGKQPGSHGIIDFERYDSHTHQLTMNSTRCLDHVRNLWQILSDKGFQVGSVNVPMTFPPIAVNGFMVSGFETPGPESDFVYPPELKGEILSRWPDPTLRTNWRRSFFGGDRLFAENVAYMSRSFHQGADMTVRLGEELGWDVLMVVFKLFDNLQHKAWKHLDSRWSRRNPTRRDIAKQAFEEADRAIGKLLDYADAHGATVLMVSDHGHGSLEGKIQSNLLLEQWGYLTLHGGGAQKATRGRYLWDRWRGRTKRFARVGDVAQDLAVDFSKTKACVMHAGMAGFLYLNLAGRQPTGIVDPDNYEVLRDELRDRFLSDACRVRRPDGEVIQLFSEVHKPEELYGCARADQPWLPDLILTPQESLAVVRKIRGRRPVRWLRYRRLEGTHRPEGVLIATGPSIARGMKVEGHIVDCAPTILASLGLRIPDDMEGRVVTELFERSPIVETEAARPAEARDGDGEIYTAQELQQVTERLADLGYLE